MLFTDSYRDQLKNLFSRIPKTKTRIYGTVLAMEIASFIDGRKEENLKPVYLLSGKERFFIDRAIEKIKRIVAVMSPENDAMQKLCSMAGFPSGITNAETGMIEATLTL